MIDDSSSEDSEDGFGILRYFDKEKKDADKKSAKNADDKSAKNTDGKSAKEKSDALNSKQTNRGNYVLLFTTQFENYLLKNRRYIY